MNDLVKVKTREVGPIPNLAQFQGLERDKETASSSLSKSEKDPGPNKEEEI